MSTGHFEVEEHAGGHAFKKHPRTFFGNLAHILAEEFWYNRKERGGLIPHAIHLSTTVWYPPWWFMRALKARIQAKEIRGMEAANKAYETDPARHVNPELFRNALAGLELWRQRPLINEHGHPETEAINEARKFQTQALDALIGAITSAEVKAKEKGGSYTHDPTKLQKPVLLELASIVEKRNAILSAILSLEQERALGTLPHDSELAKARNIQMRRAQERLLQEAKTIQEEMASRKTQFALAYREAIKLFQKMGY